MRKVSATPATNEAQVSQRPIAIHGLGAPSAPRIAASPCSEARSGRGIRAVKAGDEPAGLPHIAGAVIPTYCNDTIVHVPPVENRGR